MTFQARKAGDRAPFAPVIEKPNDTAFITENLIDIIRSGNYNKVPFMIGYTTREGLLMPVYQTLLAKSGKTVKKEPPSLEDAIPWQVGLERGGELSKQVCQKIQKVYLSGPNIDDNIHVVSYRHYCMSIDVRSLLL